MTASIIRSVVFYKKKESRDKFGVGSVRCGRRGYLCRPMPRRPFPLRCQPHNDSIVYSGHGEVS